MARQVTDEERERARRGGGWLRQERMRRGYKTGTEFADALGIRQVRLSSYENGNHLVDVAVARRIAELFGLPQLTVWRNLGLSLPEETRTDETLVEYVQRTYPAKFAAARDAAEKAAHRAAARPAAKRTVPPVKRARSRPSTHKGENPRDTSPAAEDAV